jgi:Tol biopolymer transport system component
MGEVYRARDVRLGRDVAVKVLPPEFARDPDRLARFDREARAAAALNHPNIVAVFDVDVGSEPPYVVSELLDGESLREALSRGPLPIKTATAVAIQTAQGMAAAHHKGIVHRDLKPENIFLTSDGRAKILDFGLAKLIAPEDTGAGLAPGEATRTGTLPGMMLGTVGYMSPEQVRGEPTDHRSDIFSFGAVFYEMLCGRRAFKRDTVVETMTAILRSDPPELTEDDAAIPPVLDRIVRRCLEKSPQHRFQSASDIAFALEALSGSMIAPVAAPLQPRRWWPIAALGTAAVVVAVAGLLATRPSAVLRTGPVSFDVKTFDRLPITSARFMPDGETIVYSAAPRGYTPDLYVINPNAEAPQPLGVPGAQLLSISSKGELAIIMGARHLEQRLYAGTLARMTIGSSPRPMLEQVREADWSPDGASLAIVRDLGTGRDRLEYPVGTALHEVTGYLSDPRVAPDGARVAFFEHQWRYDDRGWVKVVDRSGRVTTLAGEFWGLQGLAWTSDGSTVVFSGNTVGGYFMQPMSVPAAGGQPARTVFGVPGRFVVYDVARSGRWLAVREDLSFGVRAKVPGQDAERDLSWLGSVGAKALSGDGQWLLMIDQGPSGGQNYGVVLRKTDASRVVRLGEGNPQQLSPDGKWAAAIIATPPQLVVYPTGAGEAVRIGAGPIERFGSAEWFPDSKRLLVCGSEPSRAPRCFEQDLSGSPPRPVTPEGVRTRLAPDGRTLLLIQPDGTFQLSSVGGGPTTPVAGLRPEDRLIGWSRDSRAVFVQRGVEVPADVERVDLATGRRTLAHHVAEDGLGAVTQVTVTDWVDDGRWYAYNYTTVPSALFVVSGAQGLVAP